LLCGDRIKFNEFLDAWRIEPYIGFSVGVKGKSVNEPVFSKAILFSNV